VTSIERTAYPRFRRAVPARELHESFTPGLEEIAWAREQTRSPQGLLTLLVLLKSFQRLGCFPDLFEVPVCVVDHVRRAVGLPATIELATEAGRTGKRYRDWVRRRVGVAYDPAAARKLAEQVIEAAAQVKDNPADLINVALEELVRARLELPGYSTLDELAATVRTRVNEEFYDLVYARLTAEDVEGLLGLLVVDPVSRRSRFDDAKRTAGKATLSRFREHLAQLAWLDGLGATGAWVAGVPAAKVSHFAAQARVTDAADMADLGVRKRVVLIACLIHTARIRGRDELATMFCKRMANIHKQARDRFEALRESSRAQTEHLVEVFGDVLAAVREAMAATEGELESGRPDPVQGLWQRTGAAVLSTLADGGGVEALTASHEQVAAFHGDNYLPFLDRHYRASRSALFDLLDVLDLEATTADAGVLGAVGFLRSVRRRTGELIPDHLDGEPVDLSFASAAWQQILRDRRRPSRLVRRHFEACVFSYLAAELRSGDIAVRGSESYANLHEQLLTWEECQPLLADFCTEVGLPADAGGFTAGLRDRLTAVAAGVDDGYPDNADLVIDDAGVPVLKRRRGQARRASAIALEKTVLSRLPERSLLDVVTRVAYWTGWPRHFGPVSGSDPKIRDAFGRYVLTGFCYGTNLGPAQLARHMGGTVSAHQLAATLEHAGTDRIDAARLDVINAYAKLDLPGVWGDGSYAAADGAQIDTWSDNLLAESHIRYGGYGGIAYRHIADTYIALFTHFIPCGVWEAVYIIEGLLKNSSDIQPRKIHADTQGQSLPVYGLAHLLGFELLPRVRNWKDLIFYRPDSTTAYTHIDALFGTDKVINWRLIETHWPDLMRVALSIRAGRITSVALLRRLGHDSHKNKLYRAFRELGRAIRTIVLLRYLSEPALRDSIAVITNRMESFNGFCQWLSFGGDVLADNDPVRQEKLVKLNELLANCAIYSTTVDLTALVNDLAAEGHVVEREDLAVISPYITSRTRRFGHWAMDLTPPPPVPGRLALPSPSRGEPGL
jgi:TnpA family transposase